MLSYTQDQVIWPKMKLHTVSPSSTAVSSPTSTAVSSASSSPDLPRATTQCSLPNHIPAFIRSGASSHTMDDVLLRSASTHQQYQDHFTTSPSPTASPAYQSSSFFKRKPAHRSSTGVDHYGRHGNQWLFGDISLRGTARNLVRRRDSR